MSLHKTYIISQVQKALDQNMLAPETIPKNLGDPLIIPESVPVFSTEIMLKLQLYKDMAIAVEDFETWMCFLERITTELNLNPSTDFPKIAGVLNRYRVDAGKDPL